MYVLWKTKKLWQNGTYFSAHPRITLFFFSFSPIGEGVNTKS